MRVIISAQIGGRWWGKSSAGRGKGAVCGGTSEGACATDAVGSAASLLLLPLDRRGG